MSFWATIKAKSNDFVQTFYRKVQGRMAKQGITEKEAYQQILKEYKLFYLKRGQTPSLQDLKDVLSQPDKSNRFFYFILFLVFLLVALYLYNKKYS
jgi:hypothetical protein